MFNKAFRHNEIRISRHAQERALERTFITCPLELAKKAEASLDEGIDILSDPVLRDLAIDRVFGHPRAACGMYAYEGVVFIFKEDTLVTLLPISWLAVYGDPINVPVAA